MEDGYVAHTCSPSIWEAETEAQQYGLQNSLSQSIYFFKEQQEEDKQDTIKET